MEIFAPPQANPSRIGRDRPGVDSPAAVGLEHGVILLALEVVGPDGAVPPVEQAWRQDGPVRVAGQKAVDARLPA